MPAKSRKKNENGFTLIELLVVIAIIALLTAILFPVAKSALDRADRSTCLSNMHNIGVNILAYQQDHATFPDEPGCIGFHGVPEGGVTEIALAHTDMAPTLFWCKKDTFPDRFPNTPGTIPKKDLTDSTYNYGYNYYGYVTTTDGVPFPITTPDAADYFFDSGVNQGNLQLIDKRTLPDGSNVYRPRSLFQGLWNFHAPRDTIITFCPFHGAGENKIIPAITLQGEATFYKAPTPSYTSPGYHKRWPTPGSTQPAPIDWRLNKTPFTQTGSPAPDDSLLGDALGNMSQYMPIVQVFYRQFTARQLGNSMTGGYGFYDTGIELQPNDMVMVNADARWVWGAPYSGDPNSMYVHFKQNFSLYAPYLDDSGRLLFTAAGDPIESQYQPNHQPEANMLCPNQFHCVLVGYLGDTSAGVIDNSKVFSLGSRGSVLVTSNLLPTGVATNTLKLSLNDIKQTDPLKNPYDDNDGWCEAVIAVYRPGQAAK